MLTLPTVHDLIAPWETSLPRLARALAKRQVTPRSAMTAVAIWIGTDVPASPPVARLRQAALGSAWERIEELTAFEERERSESINALREGLLPLIAIRTPKNRLLAEAHDINADLGAPLAESEIEPATRAIVEDYLASQRVEAMASNV